MFYRRVIKPLADRLLALAALLVLSPVLLIVAVSIWARMGTPVIFSQKRIGLHDRPFELFKFRTMRADTDGNGRLLPDDARVTGLGHFLRSTSIDELPQLWNAVKGDISLVGPRPLLPLYLPRYSSFQRRRHEVKPGITGLAQVKGRNSLSWEEKFELDVLYVDTCSARLDIQIVLMTVFAIIRREGISPVDQMTAPEFLGTAASGRADRTTR